MNSPTTNKKFGQILETSVKTRTMSFSRPFYFSFSIYNIFHVIHDILAIFYIHNDFIEGNERFKLGGEDLEKLKIFKNVQLSTILKLLFSKFLPLLIP